MENQQFDILAIKNLDKKITSRWLVFWRKIRSHSYFVGIFISWITLCGRTMDVIQASRYTIQIWVYKCLKGIIPIRKCSIKSPAIWRNYVYVFTEIYHQRSKWLGPKLFFFISGSPIFIYFFLQVGVITYITILG